MSCWSVTAMAAWSLAVSSRNPTLALVVSYIWMPFCQRMGRHSQIMRLYHPHETTGGAFRQRDRRANGDRLTLLILHGWRHASEISRWRLSHSRCNYLLTTERHCHTRLSCVPRHRFLSK